MFYYLGIGINFFLLFILISKKGKSFADKILVAWLLVIGFHILLYTIVLKPVTPTTVYLLLILVPMPFLHGPLLYLYTAAITNMQPANKKIIVLHFILPIVTILLYAPFLFMNSQMQMKIYLNGGEDYSTRNFILGILMQLSGLVYVAWSFWLLRRHKKNIGNQFSYEEKINLNWLRYLIYGLLVIWITIIVLKSDELIFGAGVVFVTLLGFFGIRQVGIFNQKPLADEFGEKLRDGELTALDLDTAITLTQPLNLYPTNGSVQTAEPDESKMDNFEKSTENQEIQPLKVSESGNMEVEILKDTKRKYSRSGLSEEMAVLLHTKLLELMLVQKKYTEPELSLGMLAELLNVHPNYLSQIINEKEKCSFFDYINVLRVEEFKRLAGIPENRKFTIMSLAYDCGFNSKSSFNKNFKKITGQSPSAYLDGTTGVL